MQYSGNLPYGHPLNMVTHIHVYRTEFCLFWQKAYYAFYNINLLNVDTSK